MKKGVDYTGVTIVFACHDGNGNFYFQNEARSAEMNKADGIQELVV